MGAIQSMTTPFKLLVSSDRALETPLWICKSEAPQRPLSISRACVPNRRRAEALLLSILGDDLLSPESFGEETGKSVLPFLRYASPVITSGNGARNKNEPDSDTVIAIGKSTYTEEAVLEQEADTA